MELHKRITTLPAAADDPVTAGVQIGRAINSIVTPPPVQAGATYAEIALNMLAAAIYNARMTHNGDHSLVTWNEICRNEVTRNFYLHAARVALRTNFPSEGF